MMHDQSRPAVSVCIPTVMRLGYLREALRSVIGQTVSDWEVIIGENSGSAVYAAAVDQMVAECSMGVMNHIDVLHQPEQLTLVSNANALIAAARGEYLVYLPDDDRLCPEFLERLTSYIIADSSVDAVFSDHWIIGADGSRDRRETDRNTARWGRQDIPEGPISGVRLIGLALGQSIAIQAMIIRRILAMSLGFQEQMSLLPDVDFQLRLAQRRVRIVYCPERLMEYRSHPAQVSSIQTPPERKAFHLRYLEALGAIAPVPREIDALYRRKVAAQRLGLAGYYVQSREWRLWRETSLTAIWDDPRWVRTYVALFRPLLPKKLIAWASGIDRRW